MTTQQRAAAAYAEAMFGGDVHPVIYGRRLVLASMSMPNGEEWLARQRRVNDQRIRALSPRRRNGAA